MRTKNGMFELWQCPPKNDPKVQGNFIMFEIIQDGRLNTLLKVKLVATSYCRPQLEQCRCNSLLQSLLTLETSVNKITGSFVAQPYIAGCECYLGAAARQGFRFLKMKDAANRKECKETREFTLGDFPEMCKTLQSFNCLGAATMEITIMDPDIE